MFNTRLIADFINKTKKILNSGVYSYKDIWTFYKKQLDSADLASMVKLIDLNDPIKFYPLFLEVEYGQKIKNVSGTAPSSEVLCSYKSFLDKCNVQNNWSTLFSIYIEYYLCKGYFKKDRFNDFVKIFGSFNIRDVFDIFVEIFYKNYDESNIANHKELEKILNDFIKTTKIGLEDAFDIYKSRLV